MPVQARTYTCTFEAIWKNKQNLSPKRRLAHAHPDDADELSSRESSPGLIIQPPNLPKQRRAIGNSASIRMFLTGMDISLTSVCLKLICFKYTGSRQSFFQFAEKNSHFISQQTHITKLHRNGYEITTTALIKKTRDSKQLRGRKTTGIQRCNNFAECADVFTDREREKDALISKNPTVQSWINARHKYTHFSTKTSTLTSQLLHGVISGRLCLYGKIATWFPWVVVTEGLLLLSWNLKNLHQKGASESLLTQTTWTKLVNHTDADLSATTAHCSLSHFKALSLW